jgi:hypothetical protein
MYYIEGGAYVDAAPGGTRLAVAVINIYIITSHINCSSYYYNYGG